MEPKKCTTYASECKRNCTTSCACENSFRPSSGTEGMDWMEDFCFQCIHDHPDHDKDSPRCDIMTRSQMYSPTEPEYPREWIYQDGKPVCTNFKKWDWGNSDDGWKEPEPEPLPPDPNQISLFPLYPDETTFSPKEQKNIPVHSTK